MIKRNKTLITLIVIGLVAASIVMVQTPQQSSATTGSTSQLQKLSLIMEILQNKFVDPLLWNDMVDGAIEGVLSVTGDPYSQYLNPEDYNQLSEGLSGDYVGVGIAVVEGPEGIKIVEVFEGTPAHRVGIKPSDIIVGIDGQDATDISIEKAVSLIKGEEGTTVTLKVDRASRHLEFTVTRERIHIAAVEWELIEGSDVGYINVVTFSSGCEQEFEEAVDQLKAAGATKLVLDLRDNPGGIVTEAVEVADFFLPPGAPVVTMKQRAATVRYRTDEDRAIEWPTVVLVNENTASAAEFLAGALQDYSMATVVGQQTFGKGTAQVVYSFTDGSGLKVTTAKFLTAAGRWVDGTGLAPTVIVERPQLRDLDGLLPYLDVERDDFRGMERATVGLDVLALQKALNLLGYQAGPEDGVFGQLTEEALKRFQAARDLPVGAAAGRDDIESLLSAFGEGGEDLELEKALEILNFGS